jgi:hypothetical protein
MDNVHNHIYCNNLFQNPFKAQWLSYIYHMLQQNSALYSPISCICVFRMVLTANSDYFPKQDQVQVQVIFPTVSRPVCLGVGSPSGAHDQIFSSVGHLRPSCWGAPSLTRGLVCNLLAQFAVTLRSKSRRTHDILLSHTRLPQPGGPGPIIYVSQV